MTVSGRIGARGGRHAPRRAAPRLSTLSALPALALLLAAVALGQDPLLPNVTDPLLPNATDPLLPNVTDPLPIVTQPQPLLPNVTEPLPTVTQPLPVTQPVTQPVAGQVPVAGQDCSTLAPAACASTAVRTRCCWQTSAEPNGCVPLTLGVTRRSSGLCACQLGEAADPTKGGACVDCITRGGFYGGGATSSCRACPANTNLTNPLATNASAACAPCPRGSSTNRLTGQLTCAWAAPGFYLNTTTAALTPCEADTFADGTRPLNASTSCLPCPPGLTTNGTTGNGRCRFVQPGFRFNNVTGTADPCPPNTATNRIRFLGAANTCPACGRGATTNGTTGNVVCGWVLAGRFFDPSDSLNKPCRRDTFASEARPISEGTTCTHCELGLSTNGSSGATSCDWVSAGFFYNGTGAQRCPPDTFGFARRRLADATACTPCAPGSTTSNATGSARCEFILPGFFAGANRVAEPCPVDTAASQLRSVGSARSCMRCDTGATTNGATGQTRCTAVLPGHFWNPVVEQAWICPANKVAPGTRLITDPAALRCDACPAGLSTNGSRAQSSCDFVATGFKAVPGGAPVPCEPGTFSAAARLPTVSNADQCTKCECPALPNLQFSEQGMPRPQESLPCPVPRARMATCRANAGPVCSAIPNFCDPNEELLLGPEWTSDVCIPGTPAADRAAIDAGVGAASCPMNQCMNGLQVTTTGMNPQNRAVLGASLFLDPVDFLTLLETPTELPIYGITILPGQSVTFASPGGSAVFTVQAFRVAASDSSSGLLEYVMQRKGGVSSTVPEDITTGAFTPVFVFEADLVSFTIRLPADATGVVTLDGILFSNCAVPDSMLTTIQL